MADVCPHEVHEMDTAAVADGLCPLCLSEDNARLRRELEEERARMDWLQAETEKFPRQRWFVVPEGNTLREAIDAAREAEASSD